MIDPSVERLITSWLTQLRFNVAWGPANTLNELLIDNLRQELRRQDVERRYRTSRRSRGRHKFDGVRLTLLRLGDSRIRARNKAPRPNRWASFAGKQSFNGLPIRGNLQRPNPSCLPGSGNPIAATSNLLGEFMEPV